MNWEGKFNRSEAESEDEDDASWQNSYSDLMTDLLAIFVILFAFAMMSQAIATTAERPQQNTPIASEELIIPSIVDNESSILPEQDSSNAIIESINAYIKEAGLSEQLSVIKQGDNQLLLRASDSVFFDSGRVNINSSAEPLLVRISEIFTAYDDSITMIRIEGHTDNVPIKTERLDSNWELSTSRAVNVLRRLLDLSRFEPEKVSAVGYGEFHPIDDNDTEAGKVKNRRVDFFIETISD